MDVSVDPRRYRSECEARNRRTVTSHNLTNMHAGKQAHGRSELSRPRGLRRLVRNFLLQAHVDSSIAMINNKNHGTFGTSLRGVVCVSGS